MTCFEPCSCFLLFEVIISLLLLWSLEIDNGAFWDDKNWGAFLRHGKIKGVLIQINNISLKSHVMISVRNQKISTKHFLCFPTPLPPYHPPLSPPRIYDFCTVMIDLPPFYSHFYPRTQEIFNNFVFLLGHNTFSCVLVSFAPPLPQNLLCLWILSKQLFFLSFKQLCSLHLLPHPSTRSLWILYWSSPFPQFPPLWIWSWCSALIRAERFVCSEKGDGFTVGLSSHPTSVTPQAPHSMLTLRSVTDKIHYLWTQFFSQFLCVFSGSLEKEFWNSDGFNGFICLQWVRWVLFQTFKNDIWKIWFLTWHSHVRSFVEKC